MSVLLDSDEEVKKFSREHTKYSEFTDVDMLRKEFSVDEKNSVDKSKELEPNEFGYLSKHLI